MMNLIKNVPDKRTHLIELILVILIAFVPCIFASIKVIIAGIYAYHPKTITLSIINLITWEIISLALLIHILYKRGSNLKEIGFSFSWKDIPTAILLVIIIWIAKEAFEFYSIYIYKLLTGRVLDISTKNKNIILFRGITFLNILLALINPFFEELIGRAYVISEVEYLTRNRILAVILSVGIQTLYHLSQGFLPAVGISIIFLIFSIYYVKRKRIMPVILAHFYLDIYALLY